MHGFAGRFKEYLSGMVVAAVAIGILDGLLGLGAVLTVLIGLVSVYCYWLLRDHWRRHRAQGTSSRS